MQIGFKRKPIQLGLSFYKFEVSETRKVQKGQGRVQLMSRQTAEREIELLT